MSQQGTQGPPSGASGQASRGPPYAPLNAGLGGTPAIVPDVPLAIVFLILYLIFGVIHIKIFKGNKHRGHKFIFNGAILGLCKIRIITMSLRIAWANYPRNIGLAIAANIFVYIGTIILYGVNWFFVQRIVRSQHARLGWSTPYRIFHRGGLVLLVATLLMLIISQIWQFFTRDQSKLTAFHDLFVLAQTYFTIFCFAPAVLVGISLLVPRTEVEKFGAGRLRYNIIILLISVSVLSIGQIFRCVLAWIPGTPLIDVQRDVIKLPWYLTKGSFYCFNFVTEILVIIMFAVVRVDLRFYVPNGARKSGDYSRSRVDLHDENEKNLTVPPPTLAHPMAHPNDSSQTLHRYQSSVFEDTQTLADSLQYPHSTLEVDNTGSWKVKRLSGDSSRSRHTTISFAASSKTTLNDKASRPDINVPPVPELPAEWPLPASTPPPGASSVLEHTNPPSRRGTPQQQTYELEHHQLNEFDVGDAVTDALARLESNSDRRRANPSTPPPRSHRKTPVPVYTPTMPSKSGSVSPSRKTRKRVSFPQTEVIRSRANSANSQGARTPAIEEIPELPIQKPSESSRPAHRTGPTRTPSLEIISLLNHMSGDSTRIRDASLQRTRATSVAGSDEPKTPASCDLTRQTSSKYSNDNSSATSSEVREKELAREEFRRFSSEAPHR
ncbi:hypothetical protein J4E81_000273 [Alternaria sp. BMP 2799]|uniref:uncharacterized protein n=1 Tax=Alternaria metachromatica TaxID=283354 RepID=UPI0020C56AF4|nr:uncharacterized protein J4E83_002226 [Alternaria metachromatica]KAI4634904.1 hypothetical protein J4E83_002226 [Alternaria metachromatica]KAI4705391.1 hypothetical protein J4E81_000273 [Alternaria sp. BMP 2799]